MKWGIYLLVFVICAAIANATYISITTTVKATVSNGTLVVYTNVTNQGDEAAYSVQVIATANGKTQRSKIFDVVGIRQPVTAESTFDVSGLNSGRYPLIIEVDYADANQYPFSALTSQYYIIGENVNSDVIGQMDKIEISKSGKLTLTLKNLGSSQKSLNVNMFLPKELSTGQTSKSLTLAPKSEQKLDFAVQSFSALKGSTYVVFASIEYDEANVHYTTFATSFVGVVEKKGVYGFSTPVIIAILAVLVIAFIVLQFRKKK